MALTRPKYSQIFDSDFKNSCRVATPSNVTLTGAAPNEVDGVTLTLYDRVLVKSQDSSIENGIYFVTVLGTGANGTWTRAADASDGTRLTSGTTLSVEEGTTFGGKLFRMTSPNPINLGVSDINWVDVSGGSGTASGLNGQLQFNDSNVPAGSLYAYYNKATGQLKANATVPSTSTTTGAFIVTGGVGIGGNINAGGNLTLANAISFTGGVGSGISVPYETVSGGVGYSYYFNGNSGLRYPTTSNLEFGSNNFTIEFWMNAGSSQQPYATITDSSTNNQATSIGIGYAAGNWSNTPGKMGFQPSPGYGVSGSTTVLDNTWHHIACVKHGNNGYIFVDGQLDGSTSSWSGVSNAYLSGGILGRSSYGGGNGGDNTYTGYLSNFRIVKGVALYTSNFTVPSVPLSAVANTQLLTLQNATVVDNSTNAFTFDSVGSAPTGGTTPTLEASGGSTITDVASLTLNSDGAWESSTDFVVGGAFYTDNYKFANGAAFISTSIANTSDIVANISSGIVGVSLTATGVSAGTYGNTTSIPTVVVDSKGRVTSVTNNAVSTKINLSSGAEEGGGNATYSYYVTNGAAVAPSAAMSTIGTSDFTIELFFQIGSYRYNGRIVGLGGYAQSGNFNIETAGSILIHINGSYQSYGATLNPGTWYHLAVSRTSGVVTVFLDGTSIGSQTQSGAINNSSSFYMGSNPGGDYFDGYLNNLRVVNGTGLYTANFTPPTTNLTAVSGTQLLTLQDATLVDNSTNGYSITTQGTAPVVSDSITPFSGGAASTANVANGGTLTILGVNGVTSSVTDATYTIGLSTLPGLVSSGVANIANTTSSTSTTTGALVVAGGTGIGGELRVGANITVTGNVLPSANVTYNLGSPTQRWKDLYLSGTTINLNGATISATNGAVTFQNSLGGSFSVTGAASGQSTGTFGNLVANSGVASTSVSTGALVVTGGAGITGDVWVGGTLTVANLQARGSTSIVVQDPMLYLQANVLYPWTYDTGVFSDSIGGSANTYVHHGMVRNYSADQWTFFSNVKSEPAGTINWADAGIIYDKVKAGELLLANSTASSNTTTGALVVTGGTGIGGATFIGGTLNAAGATTLQSTLGVTGLITSTGGISGGPATHTTGSFSGVVTSTVATGTAPFTVSSTTAVTNLNADLWDGNHFSDYINQAVKTTSAPTFAGITTSAAILPNANLTINVGSSTAWFNTFYGVSTQAKYADLAENYQADAQYVPGTVLVFGGAREVTTTDQDHNTAVAGIVSTNPAHLMNGMLTGHGVVAVGLTGRLPCRVQGPVTKGDVLVTSTTPGVAQKIDNSKFLPGCVVGKALESINTNNIQTIEVVVGRF